MNLQVYFIHFRSSLFTFSSINNPLALIVKVQLLLTAIPDEHHVMARSLLCFDLVMESI